MTPYRCDPIRFITKIEVDRLLVKLQKQTAYTYKDHPIYKYRINIPSEVIDEVKWKEGQELEIIAKDNQVVIHPSRKKE